MWGKKFRKTLKDKKIVASTLTTDINLLLIFLVLNALSSNLGIYDQSLMLVFSIYLLVGFVLLNLPLKKTCHAIIGNHPLRIKILFGLFLVVLSFLLLLFTEIPMLWIASISLLLSGMEIAHSELGLRRKEIHFLLIASLVYTVFYVLIQTIPVLWNVIHQFSLLFTGLIGRLIGKSLILGPSVSGLWIVIVFLIFSIVLFLLSKNKQTILKTFVLSIFSIFLLWMFYIIILGFVEFDGFYLHFILFIFCLLPIYLSVSKYSYDESKKNIFGFKELTPKKLIKNGMVWTVVFLFISTVTITTFIGEENTTSTDQKILFYGQNMLGTWDIPEYGKYGREASGMFGLLPIYLTASGYECEIAVENITTFLNTIQPEIIINNTTNNATNQSEYKTIERYVNLTDYVSIVQSTIVTEDLLKDVQVFVVVNINKSFSQNEKNVIYNFIENGGSLLVLGDHTDVGGIQQPLNELLDQAGIQFRFDSALPLDEKFRWLTSYQLLHHPVVSNIQSKDEIQISVGASLDIFYSSFPIIVGKYAFSDEGDPTNEDFAYLGDYEYSYGEQLGDVVLVAGSYYGSGKVLVFGDTSSFQNSAMAYSYPFIQDVFSWLHNEKTGTVELIKIAISTLFLAAAIIAYFLLKKTRVTFIFLPMILCLALICSATINPAITGSTDLLGDVVYIDISHGERFTLEAFTDDSLNGLILNLNRNGYLPIFLREYSTEKINGGKILILNAPTQTFTSDEITFLKQFMSDGGFVVLATGYTDKSASQHLLNNFELDIEGIPLGPVPYAEDASLEYENETRFVDSWPIIYNENMGISYYSFNFTWSEDLVTDYHLMVFVRHGSGGLLLISDSQYLLDKNIESIYDYWPGNILMLKHILDEFKEMGEQR